jgi:hypothetical protein
MRDDVEPVVRITRDGEVRQNAALSVVADGLRLADERARRLVMLDWSGAVVYMLADRRKVLVEVRGTLVHAVVVDDTFSERQLAIHRVGSRGVPIHDGVRFVAWIAHLITAPAGERVLDFDDFVSGSKS